MDKSETFFEDGRKRGWFWDCNEVFGSDLSAHAKLVRLYLARCADNGRKSWPSYNRIAKDCGISRDTAKRAVNELEQKGWIKKINRVKDDGENMSNVYILCDPPARENEPEGVGAHSTHPAKSGGVGAHSTHLGAHSTHLGADSTGVGADSTSNNTQVTIPSEQEKDMLFVSSLRSDTNSSASALRASCAAGGATPENEKEKRDSHPQAGAADAETFEDPRGRKAGAGGPSNRELIAELVEEYRAIEGIEPRKGDYAFVGALYNRYGYDRVLEAIQELALAAAVQEIGKPLLYLKTVAQSIAERDGKTAEKPGRKKQRPGAGKQSENPEEEKKRDLIKSLYLS